MIFNPRDSHKDSNYKLSPAASSLRLPDINWFVTIENILIPGFCPEPVSAAERDIGGEVGVDFPSVWLGRWWSHLQGGDGGCCRVGNSRILYLPKHRYSQTIMFFFFQIYELMGDSKDLSKVGSEESAIFRKVEKAFQVIFSFFIEILKFYHFCFKTLTIWTRTQWPGHHIQCSDLQCNLIMLCSWILTY